MRERARPQRARGTLKIRWGLGIILTVAVLGIVLPWVWPHDILTQAPAEKLQSPSMSHWFGTDEFGRDVFIRTIAAARIDIFLALAGSVIPGIIGTLLGAIGGYASRWFDIVLLRIAEIMQAMPSYVIFLITAAAIGPGVGSFILAAILIAWVPYARLTRAQVLLVRETEYVKAVKTSAVGSRRVLFRHVLPNALPQTVVFQASDIVLCLLALAGLSFLGVGVPPPTPEWGSMIAEGQRFLRVAWWMSVPAGLMLVLVGGAASLLSDGLDERNRR
ncbi:ABC transporter permease [Mycolicibacterium baixiangningiae]|uniref:ABC transporter permease n=1 Tax=Mycolicibacterium baixiangningiae TaxID=2761578 RepID=UPI0018D0A685|nr:ABC transporter permease [Mycolicibacterium baixiangningiae]